MDAPPHSLHLERSRPCSHIDAPPHSLHIRRHFPCGQALHTLHCDRYFTPCSHGPFVGGALFLFVPFFLASFSSSSLSDPSSSATLAYSRSRLGRQIVVPFPARSSDFSSSSLSSAGGSTLTAGGWWWSSSGSSLTTTGSLLNKSGCQMVFMAHGDTSYDDLRVERSQKTETDSSFSARSAQTP